jgi:transcriptional regulator with XRE-family HTH domain
VNLKERYEAELSYLRANDVGYQQAELELAVGAAIRKLVAAKKISQKKLAEKLDVSPQYVNRLLNDEDSNLTLRTLARLAAALDVRLEWDFIPLIEKQWVCQIPYPAWEKENALPIAA